MAQHAIYRRAIDITEIISSNPVFNLYPAPILGRHRATTTGLWRTGCVVRSAYYPFISIHLGTKAALRGPSHMNRVYKHPTEPSPFHPIQVQSPPFPVSIQSDFNRELLAITTIPCCEKHCHAEYSFLLGFRHEGLLSLLILGSRGRRLLRRPPPEPMEDMSPLLEAQVLHPRD